MKDGMLEFLVDMFNHFFGEKANENDVTSVVSEQKLIEEKKNARKRIKNIFNEIADELDTFVQQQIALDGLHGLSSRTTRIYCNEEIARLTIECRGFLLYLEQIGLLTTRLREKIIHKVIELKRECIEITKFKHIVFLTILADLFENTDNYQELIDNHLILWFKYVFFQECADSTIH